VTAEPAGAADPANPAAHATTPEHSAAHRVSYTVYYEDTDSLGVVYYANYFKFLERGRSEFLKSHGLAVADLNRAGYLIVVHSAKATFRIGAELGDVLDKGRFQQRIERDGALVVDAVVDVACLDADRRLTMLPPLVRGLAG
jgi:acyl-CoA thioester hydrolase